VADSLALVLKLEKKRGSSRLAMMMILIADVISSESRRMILRHERDPHMKEESWIRRSQSKCRDRQDQPTEQQSV